MVQKLEYKHPPQKTVSPWNVSTTRTRSHDQTLRGGNLGGLLELLELDVPGLDLAGDGDHEGRAPCGSGSSRMAPKLFVTPTSPSSITTQAVVNRVIQTMSTAALRRFTARLPARLVPDFEGEA
jgi:hypothetical protein